MRKLTSKEREQLKAKLDQQSVEQAEKQQKYWKHRKKMQAVDGMKKISGAALAFTGAAGAAAQHDMSTPSLESKGKELERKKRGGGGPEVDRGGKEGTGGQDPWIAFVTALGSGFPGS